METISPAALKPPKRKGFSQWLALVKKRYPQVRAQTDQLCAPLQQEDYCLQTAEYASPPKWHLAHTSWFFERFVLEANVSAYTVFDPQYGYIFNSYYEQMGGFYPRHQRGWLSRPTVAEVYKYRAHVDDAMLTLLERLSEEHDEAVIARIELGLHHEQQHQELLLTDIKHNFAMNPLRPAYQAAQPSRAGETATLQWLKYPGGLASIGHDGDGFSFDNERPRHSVFVPPYRLASHPVTNGEYMEFIKSGAYERAQYWLSDGWRMVRDQGWHAPLYWERIEGRWWQMTLAGMRPVEEVEPLCHVSFMRRTPMPAGRANVCRRRRNGNWRPVTSASPVISWSPDCIAPRRPLREVIRSNRYSAMYGNGRKVPTPPIRVIVRRRVPSANTTASSCVIKSCCAAVRA